jgi:hypothetical protein
MSKTVKEINLSNGDKCWFIIETPSGEVEFIFKPTATLSDEDEAVIGKAFRQIADASVVRE